MFTVPSGAVSRLHLVFCCFTIPRRTGYERSGWSPTLRVKEVLTLFASAIFPTSFALWRSLPMTDTVQPARDSSDRAPIILVVGLAAGLLALRRFRAARRTIGAATIHSDEETA